MVLIALALGFFLIQVSLSMVQAAQQGFIPDQVGRRSLMLFGAMVSAVGTLGYIFASSLGQIFAFGCLLSLGSAAFASAN